MNSNGIVWGACIVLIVIGWWALDRMVGFDRVGAVVAGIGLAATVGVIAARVAR
jgi:Mg/Co/Ni transporter MgtE